MRKRYQRLVVLLTLLCGTVDAGTRILAGVTELNSVAIPSVVEPQDTETVFALGLRMPLECTDLWSAELIPKLPYSVAARIIKAKSEIVAAARSGSGPESFKIVFGVGDSTARRLFQYVNPTAQCPASE
ncbi:MAG: hypothetical protein ACK5GN_14280 [Pseudomonadota bacterium]|jgi:hypothetical protein